MPELSKHSRAYVRPSPSRGSLGGVTRSTSSALALCEAAGYNLCLVETVGVGQSETMVADMVDMFVLIVPPAGGDELQGLKRGIVELADLVIVNKADGNLIPAARSAAIEYTSALKFQRPLHRNWKPPVIMVSAQDGHGIEAVWKCMQDFKETLARTGELEEFREKQRLRTMWRQVSFLLDDHLKQNKQIQSLLDGGLASDVKFGRKTPASAAESIVETFLSNTRR